MKIMETRGYKIILHTKEDKEELTDSLNEWLNSYSEPGLVGLIYEMTHEEIEEMEKDFITITSK